MGSKSLVCVVTASSGTTGPESLGLGVHDEVLPRNQGEGRDA